MPTEWTISTLKEHFETLLKGAGGESDAAIKLLTARFNAAEEALKKQAQEYERRNSQASPQALASERANG